MTRTTSKRDLPRELWQEILSRLPVKPILRFRRVSKSWRSMIDDPGFCRLHLIRFPNNRQQDQLLVVTKDVHRPQSGPHPFKSLNTFNLLTLSAFHQGYFTIPTPHDCRNWNPLSSIDGLVMLIADERGVLYPSSAPKLLLWNPSIRKSRAIPPSPRLPLGVKYTDMGFGFDPLINDYKHVRIAHLNDGSPQFVAIYTVGLGSWKTVPFQSKGCLSRCWASFRFCTPCRSRGCLFSIAFSQDSKEEELASFDLSNEVFASTSMPKDNLVFSIKNLLTVVDDECFILQQTSWGGFVWRLESSDSGSMYWAKRYSINNINGTFKLVPITQGRLETDEISPTKLREYVVPNIIGSSSSIVHLFYYIESLMLLK